MLSTSAFYELKVSRLENNGGYYLYEDIDDPDYVKYVKHADGELIIGCGVYDWTKEKMEAAMK